MVKPRSTSEPAADDPEWDATPIRMMGWLRLLPDYLEGMDPDFATLWSKGYVMDRTTCIAPTLFHACALRDGMVREHHFPTPIQADIFQDRELLGGMTQLTPDEKRYHNHSSELAQRKLRSLARAIVSTITIVSERRDWLRKSASNALVLIPLLCLLYTSPSPRDS